MTGSGSGELGNSLLHTQCHYFALNLKSLAQKLIEKNAFFVNSDYMTVHQLSMKHFQAKTGCKITGCPG